MVGEVLHLLNLEHLIVLESKKYSETNKQKIEKHWKEYVQGAQKPRKGLPAPKLEQFGQQSGVEL